ncbi:E3 ubiquitin-protein ligase rnf13 [Thoreauomyces humboldtii]|nr:E3 ubiquitin-protein ligase rnf13 [Thoreauomyces humboldtii]
MSCIAVAAFSMARGRDSPLSTPFAVLSLLRDVIILALYSTGIVLWGDQQCSNTDGVKVWIVADMTWTTLRILRTSVLWWMERGVDRRRSGLIVPTPMPASEQFWGSCCHYGLFGWVDWLCYANWVAGSWLIKPSDACRHGDPLVRIVMGMLLADTIVYCVCTGLFVAVLFSNRCCGQKLLPGFNVDTSNWPYGCPRLTVNRQMWRRRDETSEQWHARLGQINHETVRIQPAPRGRMRTTAEAVRLETLNCMTRPELEMLRTYVVQASSSDLTLGPTALKARTEAQGSSTATLVVEDLDEPHDEHFVPSPMDVSTNRFDRSAMAVPGPLDPHHPPHHPLPSPSAPSASAPVLETAIDLSTMSLPDSGPEPPDGFSTSSTCTFCLNDYVPGDRVRELPCSHVFHSQCVDPWLSRNRRTCPVCSRVVRVTVDANLPDTRIDGDPSPPAPVAVAIPRSLA